MAKGKFTMLLTMKVRVEVEAESAQAARDAVHDAVNEKLQNAGPDDEDFEFEDVPDWCTDEEVEAVRS